MGKRIGYDKEEGLEIEKGLIMMMTIVSGKRRNKYNNTNIKKKEYQLVF